MGRVLFLSFLAFALFIAAVVTLGPRLGLKSFLDPEPIPKESEQQPLAEAPLSNEGTPAKALEVNLSKLSAELMSEIDSERRLNLGLYSQLKSYRNMLGQIQSVASKVEQNMNAIEETAKDEFQEDIVLQASLFAGKKPDVIAQHLEEFRASRVGAILSKMKEKEASAVLDIWAKNKDPRVSRFYRDVMGAYLSNKRFAARPELFRQPSAPAPAN